MWLTYGTFALYAIILIQIAFINATPASTKERPAVKACRDFTRNLEPQLLPHIIVDHAEFGEYPHMAYIGYPKDDAADKEHNYSYKCVATLISKRFLLTTANCFSIKWDPAVVRLNFTDFKDPEQEFIEIPIKKVHLHPDFAVSSVYNDIALIEVDRDVPFSQTCRPACLFTEKEPPANGTFITTSWLSERAIRRTNALLSDKLLKFNVQLESQAVCKDAYEPHRRLRDGIRETQICARVTESCGVQSGSPLVSVVDEHLRIYSVVGMDSAGISCGSDIFPDIFTRVSAYLDFIESIVWPEH